MIVLPPVGIPSCFSLPCHDHPRLCLSRRENDDQDHSDEAVRKKQSKKQVRCSRAKSGFSILVSSYINVKLPRMLCLYSRSIPGPRGLCALLMTRLRRYCSSYSSLCEGEGGDELGAGVVGALERSCGGGGRASVVKGRGRHVRNETRQ